MIKNNKIIYYIYLILGFSLILYIIYIRFLLEGVPKNLKFNMLDHDYYVKMFFVILSLIICTYIIITNILQYLNINRSVKNTLWLKVTSFVTNTFDNALNHVYSFFLSFFNNKYDLLSYISTKFYNRVNKYPETLLLFPMYIIRFIIVLIFLSEIFLKFKLEYFYKVLILLCIIMFIKFFIFILKDFASNVEAFRDALIIEDNDLNYVIQEYILCNKLSGYLEMYDKYLKFFNPRVNIVIYSLYLIGWFYVIIHNI